MQSPSEPSPPPLPQRATPAHPRGHTHATSGEAELPRKQITLREAQRTQRVPERARADTEEVASHQDTARTNTEPSPVRVPLSLPHTPSLPPFLPRRNLTTLPHPFVPVLLSLSISLLVLSPPFLLSHLCPLPCHRHFLSSPSLPPLPSVSLSATYSSLSPSLFHSFAID